MPNLFDPNTLERKKADAAAARFEITDEQYDMLMAANEWQREHWLWTRLRQFDDARRSVIGVRGSIMGQGAADFWAEWDANKDANLQRAWDALDRAGKRISPADARADYLCDMRRDAA